MLLRLWTPCVILIFLIFFFSTSSPLARDGPRLHRGRRGEGAQAVRGLLHAGAALYGGSRRRSRRSVAARDSRGGGGARWRPVMARARAALGGGPGWLGRCLGVARDGSGGGRCGTCTGSRLQEVHGRWRAGQVIFWEDEVENMIALAGSFSFRPDIYILCLPRCVYCGSYYCYFLQIMEKRCFGEQLTCSLY